MKVEQMIEWTNNIPQEEGVFWVVDLADTKEAPELIEIKEICGKLAGRYIDLTSWNCVEDVKDFAFYGPIKPPAYNNAKEKHL